MFIVFWINFIIVFVTPTYKTLQFLYRQYKSTTSSNQKKEQQHHYQTQTSTSTLYSFLNDKEWRLLFWLHWWLCYALITVWQHFSTPDPSDWEQCQFILGCSSLLFTHYISIMTLIKWLLVIVVIHSDTLMLQCTQYALLFESKWVEFYQDYLSIAMQEFYHEFYAIAMDFYYNHPKSLAFQDYCKHTVLPNLRNANQWFYRLCLGNENEYENDTNNNNNQNNDHVTMTQNNYLQSSIVSKPSYRSLPLNDDTQQYNDPSDINDNFMISSPKRQQKEKPIQQRPQRTSMYVLRPRTTKSISPLY